MTATTPRREFPKRVKAQILKRAMNDAGRVVCEGCGLVLGKKLYEIDHTLAEALVVDKTAELTAADGKLLGLECCHKPKSADDVRRIRKADRQGYRDAGLTRSRNPMPGSRGTRFKKRMDGSVVLR